MQRTNIQSANFSQQKETQSLKKRTIDKITKDELSGAFEKLYMNSLPETKIKKFIRTEDLSKNKNSVDSKFNK